MSRHPYPTPLAVSPAHIGLRPIHRTLKTMAPMAVQESFSVERALSAN